MLKEQLMSYSVLRLFNTAMEAELYTEANLYILRKKSLLIEQDINIPVTNGL